ncbi:MAG: hypothetical protein J7L15_04725 [Clostridiales bacterium]|nr:hypothetical protein [Clostridiales bacterium]
MTSFKNFTDLFKEETSSGDIAVFTGRLGDDKGCEDKDTECKKKRLLRKELSELSELSEFNETAPGQVGRTGYADADRHLSENPELIKRFKKIIKELGGLTSTRKLLQQFDSKGM